MKSLGELDRLVTDVIQQDDFKKEDFDGSMQHKKLTILMSLSRIHVAGSLLRMVGKNQWSTFSSLLMALASLQRLSPPSFQFLGYSISPYLVC